MTQLSLPHLPEIDPRTMQAAARRLQKIIDGRRSSFECEQYRRRRTAALKGLAR